MKYNPFSQTKSVVEFKELLEDVNSDAKLSLPVKCLLPVVASSASCLLPLTEGALDFQMRQLKKLPKISSSPTWPLHHQHHPQQTFSAFLGLGRFELHFIAKNKVSPKPKCLSHSLLLDSLTWTFSLAFLTISFSRAWLRLSSIRIINIC